MKTLTDSKQEILQRLELLRADAPRRWGKMTAHQMICHLSDSYRVGIGEVRASDASGLLQRTVMKWGALWTPVPWPHGVPTRPELDQAAGCGSAPVEFAGDVSGLCAVIHRFTDEPRDFQWGRHPLFGAIPVRDWMRWGYLHADHHLRQFGC